MSPLEQILLALLTVLCSGLVSYLIVGRQLKADLEKHYETKFNEKKWEVYSKFTEILQSVFPVYSLFWNEEKYKNKELFDEYFKKKKEFDEKSRTIESQILLIGSSEVVSSFLDWQRLVISIDIKSEVYIQSLIKLLNAMRQDLGREKSLLNFADFDGFYYFSAKKINYLLNLLNTNPTFKEGYYHSLQIKDDEDFISYMRFPLNRKISLTKKTS